MEEEMETHSSILAWKTPRAKESGGLQSMGCKDSEWLSTRLHSTKHLHIIH